MKKYIAIILVVSMATPAFAATRTDGVFRLSQEIRRDVASFNTFSKGAQQRILTAYEHVKTSQDAYQRAADHQKAEFYAQAMRDAAIYLQEYLALYERAVQEGRILIGKVRRLKEMAANSNTGRAQMQINDAAFVAETNNITKLIAGFTNTFGSNDDKAQIKGILASTKTFYKSAKNGKDVSGSIVSLDRLEQRLLTAYTKATSNVLNIRVRQDNAKIAGEWAGILLAVRELESMGNGEGGMDVPDFQPVDLPLPGTSVAQDSGPGADLSGFADNGLI